MAVRWCALKKNGCANGRVVVLAEHQLADDHRGDHAGEIGDEAGGDSVAGAADGDGAEVDGENVEGGFTAAKDGAGHARGEGVGA